MLSAGETRRLKAGMLKIWIIWIAMFLSLLLSLLCVFVPGENAVKYDIPTLKQITNTLYGVALVGLISAFSIRKFMLRQASTKPIDIENEKTSAQISPYIARYIPAVTVSLAIAESIAAFGLTIFFMSRDLKTFVTFLITFGASWWECSHHADRRIAPFGLSKNGSPLLLDHRLQTK